MSEGRTVRISQKVENAGARPKDRPVPGYQQDDQPTDARTSDRCKRAAARPGRRSNSPLATGSF